jgi:hypothetical protein
MGRYQRKPYKKQKLDIYHQKSIEDEIEDELDIFFNQEQEESILFFDEEPMLFKDEPSIVKQLREEELQGKLPMWLADFNKEKSNDVVSEESDQNEETSSLQSKMLRKIRLMKKNND